MFINLLCVRPHSVIYGAEKGDRWRGRHKRPRREVLYFFFIRFIASCTCDGVKRASGKRKRPFTVNALWLLSPTLRFEEKWGNGAQSKNSTWGLLTWSYCLFILQHPPLTAAIPWKFLFIFSGFLGANVGGRLFNWPLPDVQFPSFSISADARMFKWLNYLDHIDSATRDDNAPDTVTLLVSMSDKRALRADTAPFHIPLLILSNFESFIILKSLSAYLDSILARYVAVDRRPTTNLHVSFSKIIFRIFSNSFSIWF